MGILLLTAVLGGFLNAQSDTRQLQPILSHELQNSEVTGFQLRQYAMKRIPPLRIPQNATAWTLEAQRIRKHLLNDVIFHGWPAEWVNAPPRFEVVGPVPGTTGYRAVKLRYEVVPRFYSSAILYEPERLSGKVPAILNVNGHVGPIGKAVEYKQKRCINFARQGMIALNLEWIGFGELTAVENRHSFAGHLDLVGANGVGLFYLAMRKGLDYLEQHANVDRTRLGVTGLSGGGWQTITLSALDERVAVAVPVAGYSSLTAGIEHPEYVGNDLEQNATDFRDGQDYTHLTAMRAPRPTLLIYNAEDDCCFRAGIVKPGIFDDLKPWFLLFGKPEAFRWHENADPGTHNYQVDNRLQAYRFFSEQFRLPRIDREIPVDSEIKTPEELEVGLPKTNLTMLGVAKRLAESISPPANSSASDSRRRLAQLIRYRPVKIRHVWAMATTKSRGVETRSYVFEFDNGLCATGVLVKSMSSPDNAPVTLVLRDKGKATAAADVAEYANRGDQVLALDLLFFGDNSLTARRVPQYTQLLAAIGDRPLAMEAAQLLAIASWVKPQKRIVSTGMRTQLVSLTAAALEPAFREVKVRNGIASLRHLLDAPVGYEEAPDLFCLDLYKEFDVPRLSALSLYAGRLP
ncbi:MAG TPA: prolyl oligopeptidase family serine peptidase [Bryobacteraceae bacterium]|nr:prolyl oligopeptidase family serine peptidase [Bryobacteraceae bacterium]